MFSEQQQKASKEAQKQLRAMDLRLAALQGACGECKRELQRLRDEANNLVALWSWFSGKGAARSCFQGSFRWFFHAFFHGSSLILLYEEVFLESL